MQGVEEPQELLVREYFHAVDAQDIEGVLELFHDEIVYERPGYDTISGKQQLRHFFSEERVIGDGRHEIEGVLVDGHRVAAWGKFAGRSRAGADLSERFCDVYEIRDHAIYHRQTYFFRPAV